MEPGTLLQKPCTTMEEEEVALLQLGSPKKTTSMEGSSVLQRAPEEGEGEAGAALALAETET